MSTSQKNLKRRTDLQLAAQSAEDAAAIRGISRRQRASALSQAGICRRVLGDYDKALDHFKKAIRLRKQILAAGDGGMRISLAASYRDRAMVYYCLDTPESLQKAVADVKNSERHLRKTDGSHWLNTIGFRGRIRLRQGKRKEAAADMRTAYKGLRKLKKSDHPSVREWELNALIWLLKVLPAPVRLLYVPRGVFLVIHERNVKRAIEFFDLVVGDAKLRDFRRV